MLNRLTEAPLESVTLRLPGALYQRAQQTAAVTHRSLEQFLLDVLASGMPLLADLPAERVEEMATLALLNDAALWWVARQTLAQPHYARLDELLAEKNQRALSRDEQEEQDQLLVDYDRVVLQRAQAPLLLKQRGYDLFDPGVLRQSQTERA
jgi:hypothetical protein